MEELIFIVKESDEGGFIASALEQSIVTDGDTMEELRSNVKEAVHCHFDDSKKRLIRLHMVKEEIFSS